MAHGYLAPKKYRARQKKSPKDRTLESLGLKRQVEKKNPSQGSEKSLPERQLQNGGEGGECRCRELGMWGTRRVGHFWSLTCAPGPSGAVEYTGEEGLTRRCQRVKGGVSQCSSSSPSPGACWDMLWSGLGVANEGSIFS